MKNANVVVKKKAIDGNVAEVATAVETPSLTLVKKAPLFQLTQELNRDDIIALGATEAELDQRQERMITIDAGNAKLVFGKALKGKLRDLTVEGQIVNSATLVSAELDYKILIVGTTSHTYFTLFPGPKMFGFYIQTPSQNAQDAVLNLIANNLYRGKETFEKSAERLYPNALFFWELLQATTPESAILPLSLLKGPKGKTQVVKAKLYYTRDDRLKTALSISGNARDFDFKAFPEYYGEAIRTAVAEGVKLDRKLNTLVMDKAAQFKPTQKKRSEKAVQIDPETTRKNLADFQNTLQSVRERAHELGQEKVKKVKAVPEKTAKEQKKAKKK